MSPRLSLCEDCLRCIRVSEAQQSENDQESSFTLHHQSSPEPFEHALDRLCLICNHLKSMWSIETIDASFSTEFEGFTQRDDGIRMRFRFQQKELVTIYLKYSDDNETIQRFNEPYIATSTSDNRVLEEARRWMRFCEENHPDCMQHLSEQTYHPQRLIDLLPEDLPIGCSWRLIDDTSDLTGNYATISHRWGQGALEPFKLLQETYSDMIAGLPDTRLSGTYRDAMRVVRQLGIRYIWIDSLCVPQDPGTLDIQVAAHRMAEIYGHSACNIATLTARQDTIFSSRDSLLYSPSATMLPATMYDFKRSYALLLAEMWTQSVSETPLSSRGWILQEQLLPKRVLYFGENQMLWSCLEGAFCELYPMDDLTCNWLGEGMYQGDMGSLRSNLADVTIPNGLPDAKGILDGLQRGERKHHEEPVVDWMDLLMLYGQRQLTFAEDKLLAIAGISRLLVTKGDILVAGMMRSEFPGNLLWVMDHSRARLNNGTTSVRLTSVDRAPSWSWAYCDGPLSYSSLYVYTTVGMTRARDVAQVITIETEVKSIDQVQIVSGGDLHLLGASMLLEPRFTVAGDSKRSSRYWLLSFKPYYMPESSLLSTEGSRLLCNHPDSTKNNEWDEEKFDGKVLFDVAEYIDLQEQLHAVFVSITVSSPEWSKPTRFYRFDGLILRRHPKRDNGVYERVGVFAVVYPSDSAEGPDVPMIRHWHFNDYLTERGDDSYPYIEYDFESADFMREFVIA